MPQFRFTVVVAGSGQTRKGRLKAQDREQARRRLEGQGFVIKSLTAVADGASFAVSGGAFREPLIQRLLLKSRAHQSLLFVVLTLLGMIVTVLYWDRGGVSPKARPYQVYRVIVTGTVDPSRVARVKVLNLRLPEIPARFQFSAEEAVSKGGQLLMEVSFESSRAPQLCEVTIGWASGASTQLPPASLRGQPLTAELGQVEPP